MISICWNCGGSGEYLEDNVNRAIECFGCEKMREMREQDEVSDVVR